MAVLAVDFMKERKKRQVAVLAVNYLKDFRKGRVAVLVVNFMKELRKWQVAVLAQVHCEDLKNSRIGSIGSALFEQSQKPYGSCVSHLFGGQLKVSSGSIDTNITSRL